ncbi:glycosyltransferase family 2 protein [Patescibacteria group bacterium]
MKKDRSIDLSIIIVNFNTRVLLKNCLKSIYKSNLGDKKIQVLVSDNGSKDGSIDMVKEYFPKVLMIENNANLGFSKANNIGINKSFGRYILLLNSDTLVAKNTLLGMIKFMEKNKNIGLSTCKLELADGSIDPACHRGFPTPVNAVTYLLGLENMFPKSRIFSGYHQWYKNLNKPHQIDCPSGAFFLIPRSIIKSVGNLDEDYFMYGEDIDWAYRIKKSGHEVWFNPNYKVIHLKKKSGRANVDKVRKRKTDIMFHTNNKLFYTKNYSNVYHPFVNYLVYLFYDFRLFLVKKVGI